MKECRSISKTYPPAFFHLGYQPALIGQSYSWSKFACYSHCCTSVDNFSHFRLMENAKEIMSESLPIKCLEAVILALYLTAPLTNIHRFAISFKSNFNELYYRHVVLGISSNSSYGALGLSRRDDLMYKPLQYRVSYNST